MDRDEGAGNSRRIRSTVFFKGNEKGGDRERVLEGNSCSCSARNVSERLNGKGDSFFSEDRSE